MKILAFLFIVIAFGLLNAVSCEPTHSIRTCFISTSQIPVPASIATNWKDFFSYSKKIPRGELQLTIQQVDPATKPTALSRDSFDVILRIYHVRSAMSTRVDTVRLLMETLSEPIVLIREDSWHYGPDVRDSVDRETWVLGRIYIPSAVNSIRAEFNVRSSFINDLQIAMQSVLLVRQNCTK